MSVHKWRSDRNIFTFSSASKNSNYDSFQNNRTTTDDVIILWCDTSINENNQDDQCTLSQLHVISEQVFTFINESGCLNYIDECREKDKLLMIVSGSLGRTLVPKICHRSEIHSIYVFCGRKAGHESWAKKYKKIKGVYDKISELRIELKREKEKLENERLVQKIADYIPKLLPGFSKLLESANFQNSKDDNDHQAKDDMKKSFASENVLFSKQVPSPTTEEVDISNNLMCSESVTPHTHYKQQMEFADNGIWPCVSVISSTRNSLVNHLHSSIEIMQYFNSSDNFLQHFHNRPVDPHFIILSNPTTIDQVSSLIQRRVRRLYIYCSNNRLHEYDVWRERYPQILSVMQHLDTLTRLILWDLSACIVDIANYYDGENKKDLAQTRYQYAYRLHHIIQGDLNNRIEMIEYNQEVKSNN